VRATSTSSIATSTSNGLNAAVPAISARIASRSPGSMRRIRVTAPPGPGQPQDFENEVRVGEPRRAGRARHPGVGRDIGVRVHLEDEQLPSRVHPEVDPGVAGEPEDARAGQGDLESRAAVSGAASAGQTGAISAYEGCVAFHFDS